MNLRPRIPTTLSARLVATAVALVAVVGLLVSVATAFAMNTYLTDRLDKQIAQSMQREEGRGGGHYCPTDSDGDGNGGGFGPPGLPPGQASGTLTVRPGCAFVLTDDGSVKSIDAHAAGVLATLPQDGSAHEVSLGHLGEYRVIATSQAITGLPTTDVSDATRSLVLWELALTLLGVLLAGVAGQALVRRQLAPLRAVAATAHQVTTERLDSGAPAIEARVPDRLTDEKTEVGQVGAALNDLLDHVHDALTARHASEQQVRQFVADASHELRTPLSTIQGYSQLARRTPDDAGQLSASMAKVETEAGRMASLVEDLLLLARLDSGRPLAREEVDLTKLLLEAVADARVIAPDHRWRLQLPDEPIVVVGDEQRLHQLVTNLLNNARTHTPAGTTVHVNATLEPVSFSVTDDGPGLPEQLAEHAFERFTRGDSSRTRASGGAGLGLSMVSAIASAHGGDASVESAPGRTTFTVTLPG